MPFNLQKLDEKIARLQEVRRIVASDPEMAAMLAGCLLNGTTESSETASILVPKNESRIATKARKTKAGKRSGLKETVLSTVRECGTEDFTVNDIFELMTEAGFRFRSKKPKVAAGIELRKLHANGQLDLVERGSGSKPSVFRNPVAAT